MLAALAVGGCGGAKTQPSEPAPAPREAAPEPAAADSAGPDSRGPDSRGPAAKPAADHPGTSQGPSNVDNNQDYEISDRDCRALAAAYAEAWRLDEIAKIPAGLSEAERDKVEGELDGSSSEMREQYLGQCRNTVGTAYPYDNLKCAMKAKSMQRFDDCMAGKL